MLSRFYICYNNNNNNNNNKEGGRKFGEVMNLFMALMVEIVSWVYTYPQIHRVVYVKYIVFYMSIVPQ